MKNQKKKIAIIIIIISIFVLCLGAYARYISVVKGKAEAQIAQFNFSVNGTSYIEKKDIVFAITRKDDNKKIAENMLAPGTYGEIPININAEGTETFLEYTIELSLENKPENLRFYRDEARTQEVSVNQHDEFNSSYTRKGFFSFNDGELTRQEHIYWSWPLETGQTYYQVDQNDRLDSKWMDKIMKMKIEVKSVQVSEEKLYLENEVDVKQKIIYQRKDGSKVEAIVVNKNGDAVEIMPLGENGKAITVGNVELHGIDGYVNAISNLNNAAKDAYTGASRAMTIEDVNRITGFDASKVSYQKKATYNESSSGNKIFIIDDFMTINGDDLLAVSLPGKKVGDTIKINERIGNILVESVTIHCKDGEENNRFYEYNASEYPLRAYFGDDAFWLASKCYYFTGGYCYFSMRYFSRILSRNCGSKSYIYEKFIYVISKLWTRRVKSNAGCTYNNIAITKLYFF